MVCFWKMRSICSKEGEWPPGWKSWCNEDKRTGPHMHALPCRIHSSVWDVRSDHRGLWQDSFSLWLHVVILHHSMVIDWVLTSIDINTVEESERIGKKWSFVMLLFRIINLGDHCFLWEDPYFSDTDTSLLIWQWSHEAERSFAPFFSWWDQSMDIGLRPSMLVLPWLSSTLVSDCQETVGPWLVATICWRKSCAPGFPTLSCFLWLMFLTTGIKAQTTVIVYKAL